jgi:hypothetical protein
MITKAQRAKAIDRVTRLQGHTSILIHKLATRPLPMSKLEDIQEHLAMAKADFEELESVIRSAVWRTQTHERRTPDLVGSALTTGVINTLAGVAGKTVR